MEEQGKGAGGYFRGPKSRVVDVDEGGAPRFVQVGQLPINLVDKGVGLKPIYGNNLMLSFVYMKPHSVASLHAHPEEQMGLVLDGEYEFELNGVRKMIGSGDVYIVPPNVPHAAYTYEKPCVALDIFAPPRTGYQEMIDAARKVMTLDEE